MTPEAFWCSFIAKVFRSLLLSLFSSPSLPTGHLFTPSPCLPPHSNNKNVDNSPAQDEDMARGPNNNNRHTPHRPIHLRFHPPQILLPHDLAGLDCHPHDRHSLFLIYLCLQINTPLKTSQGTPCLSDADTSSVEHVCQLRLPGPVYTSDIKGQQPVRSTRGAVPVRGQCQLSVDLVVNLCVYHHDVFCAVRNCNDAGVGASAEGASVWRGAWRVCSGCERYFCQS